VLIDSIFNDEVINAVLKLHFFALFESFLELMGRKVKGLPVIVQGEVGVVIFLFAFLFYFFLRNVGLTLLQVLFDFLEIIQDGLVSLSSLPFRLHGLVLINYKSRILPPDYVKLCAKIKFHLNNTINIIYKIKIIIISKNFPKDRDFLKTSRSKAPTNHLFFSKSAEEQPYILNPQLTSHK